MGFNKKIEQFYNSDFDGTVQRYYMHGTLLSLQMCSVLARGLVTNHRYQTRFLY